MINGYFDFNFEVCKEAENSTNGDGKDMQLLDLGRIALISNHKLTTSSGKLQQDISPANILSLMYEIITSAKDCDDLSNGVNRDRRRRQQKLTKNQKMNGKYHVRIMVKHVTKQQEKTIKVSGKELTLTGKKNDAFLNKADESLMLEIKFTTFMGMYPKMHLPSLNENYYLSRFI